MNGGLGKKMKILIDGKEVQVGFWSFLKCNFITNAAMTGLLLAFVLLLTIIFPDI